MRRGTIVGRILSKIRCRHRRHYLRHSLIDSFGESYPTVSKHAQKCVIIFYFIVSRKEIPAVSFILKCFDQTVKEVKFQNLDESTMVKLFKVMEI